MEESTTHILELGAVLPAQVTYAALVESEKPFDGAQDTDPFYKLVFVRTGALQVRAGDDHFDVEAGQALLILPNETSCFTHATYSNIKYYFAFFTVEEAKQADVEIVLNRLTTVNCPDRLTALFHLLLGNKSGYSVDTPTLRLLFTLILTEAAQDGASVPIEASSAAGLVDRGKAYVRRHFPEPLTTAAVADALDVNPGYFGRLFRRYAGMSLSEFIAITRTYSARVQLAETDKPIKQVAKECGFEDAAYFSRVFQKREGMSPKAYRQLHSGIFAF